MNIRKGILSLLAMTTLSSQAIPVDPRPRKVLVADGTTITVTLVGDEHGSWAVAEDGRNLRFNDAINAYEYMTQEQFKEMKNARVKHSTRFALPLTKTEEQQWPEPGQKCNDYPTVGERHSLVILVEFQDQKFESVENPKEYYTRQLNEPGFSDNGATGSARDFYLTASNGLFKPTFDVVGPILLPREMAYYGANEGSSSDVYVGRICYDAVIEANDQGLIDFTQYDLNEDGWVDNIFIYYAGYGEADSGIKDCVWPHSTDISKHEDFEPLIFQGKQVGSYACSNELRYNEDPSIKKPTGIGTFVHEFGHTLGLPDLYTTIYNPLVHHPNKWSTMASGSYNNDMNTPPTFSSYERFSLGWITPQILTASVDDVLLLQPLTEKADAFLVPVEGSKTEYFMYENRQKEDWDEYLPGHGMLIWHIDYDEEKWKTNNVNNDYSHQYIDIVEADGKADTGSMTGDAMPGSAGIKELTLHSWSGQEIAESPCFVKEEYNDATGNICITFSMMNPEFIIPEPSLTTTNVTAHTITASWTPIAGATSYQVAIAKTMKSDNDENNDQIVNTTSMTHTFCNLEASQTYSIIVKAYRGYASSAENTLEVTTAELPFEERIVENVNTTSISNNGFSAQWDEVKDACTYDIDVYTTGYGTDLQSMGYDFTDKSDGMPALWESSSTTYYSISGYYGDSSPSLRMSKDQDYLVIAYPEKMIRNLSFWTRAQKAQGTLIAQTRNDEGEWIDAESKNLSAEATTFTYTFSEPQKEIRLLYNRDGGFVCIDDVVTECISIERKSVSDASKNIDFIGKKATISGLKPNTTYGYKVKAYNAADMQSLPSPEQTLTTSQGDNEPIEEATDAVLAYGYKPTSAIGFEQPTAYHVAISVDNASTVTKYIDVENKRISSILIHPLDYTDATDFKVWLSTELPTTTDGADLCTIVVDASSLIAGQFNEIRLPEAVSGARYAGYSFVINKVETDCDANAIPLATGNTERNNGVAWIAEQTGNNLSWFDYSEMFGSVVLGVRLEGEFTNGGVIPVSASEVRAVANDNSETEVTFLNLNASPAKSVGYTFTNTESSITATTEIQDVHNYGLLEPFSIRIPVTAPSDYGRKECTLIATNVNGNAFDYENKCTIGITSLAKAFKQQMVEEEFTGTSCGNCPRGMKGMEITQSKYPDVIAIAIHSYSVTDPMYIHYAYTANGYPACYINRTSGEIDPYFGKPTSQCVATDLYGLDHYFMSALPLADAGVNLTAEWDEDGKTLIVDAIAEIANNLTGKYRLEFVVTGDDLHGSSNSWAQVNYFSGNTSYSNHPDLSEFVDMPYQITGINYQHVALQWWGGNDTFVLNNLSAGDINHLSTTLDFSSARFYPHPEQYGFDRNKSSLIALLVKDDGTSRGEIINATKVALGDGYSNGILEINTSDETGKNNAIYDIMGRLVNERYKGIVIKNGKKIIR